MALSITPAPSANRQFAAASVTLSAGAFPGDGGVTSRSAPVAFPLEASGGTGPYLFQVVAGRLPAGLRLDAGGSIFGQPEVTGAAMVTVRVTDSSSPQEFADFDLQLTVN